MYLCFITWFSSFGNKIVKWQEKIKSKKSLMVHVSHRQRHCLFYHVIISFFYNQYTILLLSSQSFTNFNFGLRLYHTLLNINTCSFTIIYKQPTLGTKSLVTFTLLTAFTGSFSYNVIYHNIIAQLDLCSYCCR